MGDNHRFLSVNFRCRTDREVIQAELTLRGTTLMLGPENAPDWVPAA